ncbi:hypothetical protein C453_09358 [Haloferax elongans ATCC BAA-1513]|uniref:Uncharacterized protein n=1 Tax=Haloferax elongans ATCC BAA-1513 TaxID=1230453 RepID=M0HQL4_HALEO|nr:hypothetical protein [Haloferax elongans]ELZ86013.1 hypothetical protein C453_09358 [Haloferax elongans ATCC BAA-1513]
MNKPIKLSHLRATLQDISYPVERHDAANAFDGVTILLADGDADLGALIRDCVTDEFDDPMDLYYELHNAMPIAALGEPGQSDGDA